MTSPSQSPEPCFADRALHATVAVVENVPLARDTYRLRFDCPAMASRFVPGQFMMVRLSGFDDPLLGRPLALYDTVPSTVGEPIGLDVVYLVKGKLTRKLADLRPGQQLDVWGPLGNGFPAESDASAAPIAHLAMVAGGIGQTPFMAVAREALGLRTYGDPRRQPTRAQRVTLCYGARTADYLADVEAFRALGVDVQISTDDGSAGHHGLVTERLDALLASAPDCRVLCCGPERMMETVSQLAVARRTPCPVSLETPMACGIGICFSCVAKVRDPAGGWDYRRTCVEGPIFDAAQIVW